MSVFYLVLNATGWRPQNCERIVLSAHYTVYMSRCLL